MENHQTLNATDQTLHQAAGFLAERINSALTKKRPTRRGRKSDLAGDLYVRGAAEALGITVTHMSRIITGRSRPGMSLANAISKFANCTIEEILAVSNARMREVKATAQLDSGQNVE